jgi:DNA-binding beta-propeller fold protein YncE
MGLTLRIRHLLGLALLTTSSVLAMASGASAFEYLGQYGIGLPGGGSGQLTIAAGISVSPDGTVAAADVGDQRVELFTQGGKFLRAFGTDVSIGGGEGPEVCTTDCKMGKSGGTGAGELSAPWGVVATAGEIYVSEISDNRISVFDYQGHFLRAFGSNVGGPGVNVCTTSCAAGTPGQEAGQMAGPASLALDATGALYVAEVGTNRVDVFDPKTGQFRFAFGKDVGGPGINTCTTTCFVGVADATPGSLKAPYGVAISPRSEVYVAENGASEISVFNMQGQFLRQFGSPGPGPGQLNSPYGVGLDRTGNVYVADTMNQRISVFGEAGDFRRAMGSGVVPGGAEGAEVCTTLCQAGKPNAYGVGEFTSPYSIGSDCRGTVYFGIVGRIDRWGEPGVRTPPCASNAFSFGKAKKNRKKGTLTVDVTVPGPGTLVAAVGKKLSATVPQPAAAGIVHIKIKAAGKGVKSLARSGKLKGRLTLTFTPPNEDPNTQSKSIQLSKKLKKAKGHKGGKK